MTWLLPFFVKWHDTCVLFIRHPWSRWRITFENLEMKKIKLWSMFCRSMNLLMVSAVDEHIPQCLGAEHCVSAVACGGCRLTLVHWSSGENSFIWSPAADFHREVRGHGSGSGRRVAPPELPGSRSRSHEVTRIEGGILVVRNGPGLICWSCRMDLNKREHLMITDSSLLMESAAKCFMSF